MSVALLSTPASALGWLGRRRVLLRRSPNVDRMRAAAETVPSVHETSERVVRASVFGVAPASLGVGGWPAWGASPPVTTVCIASVAMVAAVVIAAAIVDERNAGGYGAPHAWLYATVLTVGCMVSRGLAKSGSRDRHTEDR